MKIQRLAGKCYTNRYATFKKSFFKQEEGLILCDVTLLLNPYAGLGLSQEVARQVCG